MIWDSSDLVVATGSGFKQVGDFLFCETSFKNEALKLQSEAFLRDFLFLQKSNLEAQKRSISDFCETSFKIEALKIKNEAFLRDFLQRI